MLRPRTEAFSIMVKAIQADPPCTGFGFRHYQNGLNPNYRGPYYGKSTIMDAYYQAGVNNRKQKQEG